LLDNRAVVIRASNYRWPKAESGRLGWHGGPADIVDWREGQDAVDDADPVEADHHRHPAGDRRGLVAPYVPQPAHVPLDVHPHRGQRIEAMVGTPAQEDQQGRLGTQPVLAPVAAQIGRHCGALDELIARRNPILRAGKAATHHHASQARTNASTPRAADVRT
jgi:hypothetical protein